MNIKPISRTIVFSTLAFTLVFDTKNLPDDETITLANTEFHASFSTLLKCFDEYERFTSEGKAFIFRGMELRSMNCYLLYENGNSAYKVHHYRFHQYMNLTSRRYNDTCMVFPYLPLKVCYKMVSKRKVRKDVNILSNRLFNQKYELINQLDGDHINVFKFNKGVVVDRIKCTSGTYLEVDKAYTDFLKVLESKK